MTFDNEEAEANLEKFPYEKLPCGCIYRIDNDDHVIRFVFACADCFERLAVASREREEEEDQADWEEER